jgi:hypothetical protein
MSKIIDSLLMSCVKINFELALELFNFLPIGLPNYTAPFLASTHKEKSLFVYQIKGILSPLKLLSR